MVRLALVAMALYLPAFLSVSIADAVIAKAQGTDESHALSPSSLPPSFLSQEDAGAYRAAFAAERKGAFAEADAMLARIKDPLLKGTLLATRYLSAPESIDYAALRNWLAVYGDLPQASDIYRQALARKPESEAAPKRPSGMDLVRPSRKGRFNIARGPSLLYNGAPSDWEKGIAAYRAHDFHAAAAHFRKLEAMTDALPADDRAAAAFWTYRALMKANGGSDKGKKEALSHAARAAAEPPCFYSLLAAEVIRANRAKNPPAPSAIDPHLLNQIPVRRAMALHAIGENGLAEQELRALFAASGKGALRRNLALLAERLGLPGAKMRLALLDSRKTDSEVSVTYPMPRWTPSAGYKLEPALLYAIMRQESGFDPNARSSGGARGVMQLMPATADAMARQAHLSKRSLDPSVSMMLGQRYIEHLMRTASVGDNLIFLAAAYNAGPGTLLSWKHHYADLRDPLLFIESIPSLQTRDYVVRVIGNYWIYSSLMGARENTTAAALSKGLWAHYSASSEKLAMMQNHLGGE